MTHILKEIDSTPGSQESSTKPIVAQLQKLYDAWKQPAKAAELRAK